MGLAGKLASLIQPPEPKKAFFVCPELGAKIWRLPYNPETLKFTRKVTWKADENDFAAYPALSYEAGELDSLSFKFVLDETVEVPKSLGKAMASQLLSPLTSMAQGLVDSLKYKGSVMPAIEDLVAMTYPLVPYKVSKKDKSKVFRPPIVQFVWGDEFTFVGALDDVTFELTLFDLDGRPVRADVDASLKGRYYAPGMYKMGAVEEIFEPLTAKSPAKLDLAESSNPTSAGKAPVLRK